MPICTQSEAQPWMSCRAEALFADMGHFTRGSIQIGVFAVVVPSPPWPYSFAETFAPVAQHPSLGMRPGPRLFRTPRKSCCEITAIIAAPCFSTGLDLLRWCASFCANGEEQRINGCCVLSSILRCC